jgi:hypothetical protein
MRKRQLRPGISIRDADHDPADAVRSRSHLTDDWRPGTLQDENRL